VERLGSSFGVALRYIGSHAPRENNQWMVSRDWAEQNIHECIVGSPCRFCPALNLGLRAISLSAFNSGGEIDRAEYEEKRKLLLTEDDL
jgi:hypothetical protein